ncbi:hypothetical protein FGE12_20315 [Aggregicoccus sp. 17bor-14]|uniref:hypothetical protein n=1 Tax=Myxococcaceae TaxID=31 RepID=UPI00129CCF80|nr:MULTISPECIES: hypothetical protein [Myxococcaceae]MBF5044755.1 hypothetical protein [Simulacricoccus sp. 17bor-14]MRI90499.1 hypothetical protein [Aggregicoccus sp. 17bor-14]
MDAEVIKKLEEAGLATDPAQLSIPVVGSPSGIVRPTEAEVRVGFADRHVDVTLKPISALLTGTRPAPPMRPEPPEEYVPFFVLLELTAALGCAARGRPEPDEEFERLFRQLRRRPDGTDANPLFAYLQRAARLYLSLRDTSRAEYEALVNRLSQSARTFHSHTGSTNYWNIALAPLLQSLE